MLVRENFDGPHMWHNRRTLPQDVQKARLLTRPTPVATSPARPESAKTASSPRNVPCPRQGRNSAAAPRFTPHVSRFLGTMRERRRRNFSAFC